VLEIFAGYGGLTSMNRCRAELRAMADSPGDQLAQMQSDYEGIAWKNVERSCALAAIEPALAAPRQPDDRFSN
jgi:hypothetical protein